MVRLKVVTFCFFIIASLNVFAQKPKSYSASDIELKLEKLNVLGTALYVAAHPDDENTRLITYLANQKKVYSGYFAFTRGDGGQNLIGPEIRDQLGVIRTQELLAARRIDGGEQFFSRAVDFGYSKNPDETFNFWDREKVLGDLVWVVRKFKPDVIICRFNIAPGTTHGHHTASAILAGEAFKLANDPTAYPEQLKYVKTWQPSAIYWNTYWWRRVDGLDLDKLPRYDIGEYNPLLGQSYSEIAALSRSQHKSQGFGVSGERGDIYEYFSLVDGKGASKDLFENIDISWSRVEGGSEIQKQINDILGKYNPKEPYAIVTDLVRLRNSIKKIKNEFWKERKLKEVDDLIYACLGLYLECTADDYSATHGDSLYVTFEAINRSPVKVNLVSYSLDQVSISGDMDSLLENNQKRTDKFGIVIPESINYSQPYWLKEKKTLGMFQVNDQQMIGKAQNGNALDADFTLEIAGEKIKYERPVVFKRNDPVKGEVYRPFVVTPPVFTQISDPVLVFPDKTARNVTVKVKAGRDSVSGKVSLELPGDWKSTPYEYDYSVPIKGEEQSFEFLVTPPVRSSKVEATPVAEYKGKKYSRSLVEIEYDHIPTQTLFEDASASFVRIELQKKGDNIGYVMGAGDAIPEALTQIGYHVEIINDNSFELSYLKEFDAIILGVRALNTVDRLKFGMPKLLEYVNNGGTLLVQYNNSYRMVTDEFSPYELQLSRDRVTDEEAEVKFIDPDSPVLNFPNKIEPKDFDGWVQERGLYFPDKWGDEFKTVISTHDQGENPLNSGILVAKYGKGYFVYSSLSWFRELPAGVPGAYRLFTNLISIGKE